MTKKEQHLNEIEDFLKENEITYTKKYGNLCLHDDEEGVRNYEIEYVDSLDHYINYPKFDMNDGVDKKYFYQKSKEAEENNSFKLWVKCFEWSDDRKREVLKSYILHNAGKTPNKFYARECEIKEVKTKEARQFESEHCFYGKRGASLNLGLYTKKEKFGIPSGTLLMLYTFGANFFGKDETIEVIRVGTKKFHYVTGGSSKLLKHFVNNYPTMVIGKKEVPVKRLKFYSDYDHNIGGSMDNLGFRFDNYSKGGFMNYWVETGEVKGRQPMKHKWVMEQMAKQKCYAIPNAGVKTYLMELN